MKIKKENFTNFIKSYLCNNEDITCEHVAFVYIL